MKVRTIMGGGPLPENGLKADFRKMCTVYLNRKDDAAIVVTSHYDNGVYFETADGLATCETEPGNVFGEVVRDRLKASARQVRPNPTDAKTTSTWPAYLASKEKSGSQFERNWLRVSVVGLNESNATVGLETEPVDSDVRLRMTCNPLSVERLGGNLRTLRTKFLKWEAV